MRDNDRIYEFGNKLIINKFQFNFQLILFKGGGILKKMITADQTILAGNIYDKYHSKNLLYRFVTDRFLKTLDSIVLSLSGVEDILEIGCGEGYLLHHISRLRGFSRLEGIDVSEKIIKKAKTLYPSLKFSVGSAYNLNYEDNEFDLSLACEVLEHLEDDDNALSEMKRVTKKFCIISVPLGPLWRILNVLRVAHISSLGNTPGHMQHWNKRDFVEFIKKYFAVERVYYPLPWQMVLCRKQ